MGVARKPKRLAVVVCFLNEARYLPALLSSIDGQTRRPDSLFLVDDGSSDASWHIAEEYSQARPFARSIRRPPRPPARDRLATAAELRAFTWAVEQLEGTYDVVAKLDADLVLAPDHFERMMTEFARDKRLGIAGAYLATPRTNGRAKRELHVHEHVRGANKFYRSTCFAAIQPIPQILGWDTFDDVTARLHGWRTESFVLAASDSMHMRPTGTYDGRVYAGLRWGEAAYASGSPLPAVLGSALLRLAGPPVGVTTLALLYGWARSAWRGAPRAPASVRAKYRREQYMRLLHPRGTLRSRRRAPGRPT